MMFGANAFVQKFGEKITNSKDNPTVIGVIYFYRYASLFITSIFYLIAEPKGPFIFKAGVIVALFTAAKIMTGIYNKCRTFSKVLGLTILVETLGITLLLIPTGGLDSPFIWYALNPVLIAASFLAPYFCWVNLSFYVLTASVISSLLSNGNKTLLSELTRNSSFMILVFVLITLAVQLLSNLTRMLSQSNEANKELLNHIMSLYQIVETITAHGDREYLIQTFTGYTCRLTGAETSFFWCVANKQSRSSLNMNTYVEDNLKQDFIDKIEDIWDDLKSSVTPVRIEISNRSFIVSVVRSNSRFYGLLGLETQEEATGRVKDQDIKVLSFLSELSAIILERYELKEVADFLLISDEQNRIANEMHDSVSQRLFSIVCAMHTLSAKYKKSYSNELVEQMEVIKESANEAMVELRSCINRLSSRMKEEKVFFTKIKMYLHELSVLNGITIEEIIEGEEEILSGSLKRALYRIICEAAGNAVRHGRCSNIEFKLSIQGRFTELNIKDDGIGFVVEKLGQCSRTGLGIDNIKAMAESFNGHFQISSEPGKGTEIYIYIPNRNSIETNSLEQGGLAI